MGWERNGQNSTKGKEVKVTSTVTRSSAVETLSKIRAGKSDGFGERNPKIERNFSRVEESRQQLGH